MPTTIIQDVERLKYAEPFRAEGRLLQTAPQVISSV